MNVRSATIANFRSAISARPLLRQSRPALLLTLLLLTALPACGSDEVVCGEGTIAKGGECVPDPDGPACGAGTQAIGSECVPLDGISLDGGATDAGVNDAGPTDTTVTDTGAADAGVVDAGSGDAGSGDTGGSDACIPQCAGKQCGDDGCGGTCGKCEDPKAPVCDLFTGACTAMCVPDCAAKNCGDNGCGATCGSCDKGAACKIGICVPDAWTCKAAWYGTGEVCDCGCGAPDPDCANATAALAGCEMLQKCDEKGVCVDKTPAGWTCDKTKYAALDACDCGCGVPDPDCAHDSLPVHGCAGLDGKCDSAGKCVACTPDCKDKACGDDGCGGLCGTCITGTKTACVAGACVDACKPKPVMCGTAKCGDDGCGGSCGTCAKGQSCSLGACKAVTGEPSPLSCAGHCGSKAAGGCSCSNKCEKFGTCCDDYKAACSCTPQCQGKKCGPDGCGGVCGTCSGATKHCDDAGLCTATCKPQCDGAKCGGDGCGGTCGTCATGTTCSATLRCVPDAWKCDPSLYGDKQGCDCGCGARDSDCDDKTAVTIGCPTDKTACTAKGVCEVSFCTGNSACKANQWCVGLYDKGDGTYAGACANPVPTAGAPGQPCKNGGQCATGVCLQGLCRNYCGADSDCLSNQTCIGMPVPYGGKQSNGFAAVCVAVKGAVSACKSQTDCAVHQQKCIALIDATTLGPRYVCGKVTNSPPAGKSCAAFACPWGQQCAPTAKGPVCAPYCPGGDADCPTGWACTNVAMHDAGTTDTSDDPKVAVCTPK